MVENAADQSDQTDQLKKQLEDKSQECSNLKRQLVISRKSREDDGEALRTQMQVNEDIIIYYNTPRFHAVIFSCFGLRRTKRREVYLSLFEKKIIRQINTRYLVS